MKSFSLYISLSLLIFLCSCGTDKEQSSVKMHKVVQRQKPGEEIAYHFVKAKDWIKTHTDTVSKAKKIVLTINRTDIKHLPKMDSILVPNDTTADIAYYLPFPFHLTEANEIDKLIFFSYATQSFGAYENGELVYTGATNMGRKADPTPTGLFFTNWKAEKTTSTFNDEWELKWNFNIENKLGVGWHEYELPGYPASHSCLRLSETDARYLYDWADQWVLRKDTVYIPGTPVIVFGSYEFDKPKPWMQLAGSARALDISEKSLGQVLAPYKQKIAVAQSKRQAE